MSIEDNSLVDDNVESSWDECVVFGLNGTPCIPMRHEGLFFGFMALIGLIQFVGLCRRLMARETHYIPDYSWTNIIEWHLTFGRMGLLFVSVGIMMDNFRLFLGSFDISWPSYILDATNTTEANEIWGTEYDYSYHDINAQRFLWYYSTFLVVLFTPFLLYSTTYMLYKQQQWRRRVLDDNEDDEDIVPDETRIVWFLSSTVVVVIVLFILLSKFVSGPIKHGLRIIKVAGIWSIGTNTGYTNCMVVANSIWLSAFILVSIILQVNSPPQLRKLLLLESISINSIALIAGLASMNMDDSYWTPAISQLFLQWSISIHRKWDGIHNPDDFGRLSHEELRNAILPLFEDDNDDNENNTTNNNEETINNTSLQQPLLSSYNNDDGDDSVHASSRNEEDNMINNDDEEEQSSSPSIETNTNDDNERNERLE